MMSWLAAAGAFLGELLKRLWPTLAEERRKPREVKNVGQDEELQKDIDRDIEDQIGGRK